MQGDTLNVFDLLARGATQLDGDLSQRRAALRHEAALGMAALAGLLVDRTEYTELLLRAHEIIRDSPDRPAEDRRNVLNQLIALYDAWGRPAEQNRYLALLEEMDRSIP